MLPHLLSLRQSLRQQHLDLHDQGERSVARSASDTSQMEEGAGWVTAETRGGVAEEDHSAHGGGWARPLMEFAAGRGGAQLGMARLGFA
jgi:hypothetical protein